MSSLKVNLRKHKKNRDRDLILAKKQINNAVWNKINTFSYTISPADKHEASNVIESVTQAIHYYKTAGQDKIIIQPKFMGCYIDLYLNFEDLSKSYLISRNGYLVKESWINHDKDTESMIDIQDLIQSVYNTLDLSTIENKDNIKMLIVACEMLPWGAIGGQYIENDFVRYADLHQQHYNDLEELGLFHEVSSAKYKAQSRFEEENIDVKKLPSHEGKFYSNLHKLQLLNSSTYAEEIKAYKESLYKFYTKDKPTLRPFDVYKVIYKNDTELVLNDIKQTSSITKVPNLEIDFTSSENNQKVQIDAVHQYIKMLENNKQEGIVVKPKIRNTDIAPCLKVRNNSYLTLIYGIKFKPNYAYYFEKRKVNRKLSSSINDYKLWYDLLKVPYKDIAANNKQFVDLFLSKINQENYNKLNDPRL